MKIISISVWGDDKRYSYGALKQYELIKQFFPEFTLRLYVDQLDKFKDFPKDIELIQAGHTNTYGMFWRFLPLFESEDNIVLVRDSDSRISKREVRAVREWLDSDKSLHSIRDHIGHLEFPLMGGLFAFKGKLDSSIKDEMKNFMHYNQKYLSDQIFLRDHVFPVYENDVVIHTYKEGWFGESKIKLKNPYSFCGNGYNEKDMPLYSFQIDDTFDHTKLTEDFKFDLGELNE